MKSRTILTIFLSLVVLLLVFLNAKAILRPKKFEDVYTQRKELNSNRLTTIVELQKLYKKANGKYCDNIDTLANFYENGYIIIKNITIKDGLADTLLKKVQNMSMEEREQGGYNVIHEQKIPIKNQMNDILANLNEKREPDDKIVMENFQYIPFNGQEKYKIVTCEADHTDSAKIQKFAVYIPKDVLLNNFEESVFPANQNFLSKGWSKLLYNNLSSDIRESRKCSGLQLGDTASTSLDIKDYGTKAE